MIPIVWMFVIVPIAVAVGYWRGQRDEYDSMRWFREDYERMILGRIMEAAAKPEKQ